MSKTEIDETNRINRQFHIAWWAANTLVLALGLLSLWLTSGVA